MWPFLFVAFSFILDYIYLKLKIEKFFHTPVSHKLFTVLSCDGYLCSLFHIQVTNGGQLT